MRVGPARERSARVLALVVRSPLGLHGQLATAGALVHAASAGTEAGRRAVATALAHGVGAVERSWPDQCAVVVPDTQRRLAPAYHFTVGECLLAVLCAVAAAGSMAVAGDHNAHDSGAFASYPLMAAFGTVSHNSVWTLLVGIPFERALAWHKFFAYLSFLCGAWHGLVAIHVEVRGVGAGLGPGCRGVVT